MENTNLLFLQLAGILGLSSIVGFVVKQFKLPFIIAYLLAGVAFSFSGVFGIAHSEVLVLFSEIGIALVLFFIGMEMDMGEIKSLGKSILASSVVQMVLSTFAGWAIARFLGFGDVEGVYLGIGLAFSSTIVVVKLLLEKRDIVSLYGKLSIGILLFEDLVAIGILMAMSIGSSFLNLGVSVSFPILALFVKGALFMVFAFVLSRWVLKRVFAAVAQSTELLLLTSLAWCFVFVAISLLLGFSVAIGAFLAGVSLARSPFYYEVQGKLRPLRDFFLVLFFVYLGAQVSLSQVGGVVPLVVAFTLYSLFIKPLIFLVVLGRLGFRKRTIFQAAISMSQVSEFSLIVAVIGYKIGVVSQPGLTAVALVVVLSVFFSSLMISFSRVLYGRLSGFLGIFEHKRYLHQTEIQSASNLEDHVVVVGAHRMGGEIVNFLKKEGVPLIVLDFNPRVVQNLSNLGLPVLYGDVGDPEMVDLLGCEKAKFIVCTSPSLEDSLIFLTELKKRKCSAVLIFRAATPEAARRLYDNGASLVILPETVSGEYVVQVLKTHWHDGDYFKGRADVELNRIFRNKYVLS